MRCLIFVFVVILTDTTAGVKKVADIDGDINIAILVKNCQSSNDSIPFTVQSKISTTVWTTQRINYLQLLAPLKLGVEVYEVCNETDYFKTIFEIYQLEEEHLLGLISSEKLDDKVLKFCEVLNIKVTKITKYESFLVKASIQFLNALGWVDNVTVFAPEEHVLDEFFGYSKKEFICVKECMVYG